MKIIKYKLNVKQFVNVCTNSPFRSPPPFSLTHKTNKNKNNNVKNNTVRVARVQLHQEMRNKNENKRRSNKTRAIARRTINGMFDLSSGRDGYDRGVRRSSVVCAACDVSGVPCRRAVRRPLCVKRLTARDERISAARAVRSPYSGPASDGRAVISAYGRAQRGGADKLCDNITLHTY